MLFDLVQPSVGQPKVRVLLEGHRPVEVAVQLVDVHAQILLTLDVPMNVSLLSAPLLGHVAPVDASLVDQERVELVDRGQGVSVRRGETTSLGAAPPVARKWVILSRSIGQFTCRRALFRGRCRILALRRRHSTSILSKGGRNELQILV